MKYDCIIIGAGMSGLAAGIRLAHFGKRVCIAEKHGRGGGLNSYYHRNGIEIDTGLHAMTNFIPRGGAKNSPLMKLLRQLRIPYEELCLREQNYSVIQFPSASLSFSNDFDMLKTEISDKFPSETDNFIRLDSQIMSYNELDVSAPYVSARKTVSGFLKDELLVEMLFCPLMYYGSAVEKDMDFAQFAIMYKSIFKEGFCRPEKGIRQLIGLLEERFKESGGELRYNCEIRKIVNSDGKVEGAISSEGEMMEASNVLSSAGSLETLRICDEKPANFAELPEGQLSFIEAIFCVEPGTDFDKVDYSIKFFNETDKFDYCAPKGAFSLGSGVFCCPFNFRYDEKKDEKMLRLTVLANHNFWEKYDKKTYREKKAELSEILLKKCGELSGRTDLGQRLVFSDIFTPETVKRYTGHINGAVYGSPLKFKNGKTHTEGLYLCGTDQGFLGITGAMLSGISIANMYLLK